MANVRIAGSFVAQDAQGKRYVVKVFEYLAGSDDEEAVPHISMKFARGETVICENGRCWLEGEKGVAIELTTVDSGAPEQCQREA